MKRFVGSLVLSGVTVMVFAQAPFTIVRPPDGAHVREKVKVDIPAHSIPPGGYVGVFLNDQLIDAVVPPRVGKYYEYTLDTKARHIPDTAPNKTDKLELKLYTDYDEKARLVDVSSVNIKIGNNANIPIPADGLKLRYKFVPGQEMVYDLTQHIETTSLTQAQADDDTKPATFDTEGESARIAYDVVNAYPDGDGLLCMMFLPTKGKKYADITPDHGTAQQRWTEEQMTPVYMRVSPTGHEVFGAITEYFGFEGVPQPAASEQLLPLHPLPTLPTKPVHDGDEWASRLQLAANVNPNDWVDINSIVEPFPAKGQFVGVEWERNHPCAKLQNVIEAGVESANKGTKKPYSGDRVSVTETIYFALDTHQILKIERDLNIDRKVEAGNAMGGGMGGPMGGPMGGGGKGGFRGGMPPGVPGGMNPGGSGDQMSGVVDNRQVGFGSGGGKGGMMRPGGMGGPGVPGGFGGPGGPGGRFGGQNGMGGGTVAPPTYVRLHIFQTLTLEK